MKTIIALSVGLLFAGALASGQELTKEAKIESILALDKIDQDQMKSLLASTIPPGATPDQQARAQEMQRKVLESVKVAMEKIRPQLIKMYSETFSAGEIDDIYAFYQSPGGLALLQKKPALLSRTMALLVPAIQDIAKEIGGPK
jgi:hypothetical protein